MRSLLKVLKQVPSVPGGQVLIPDNIKPAAMVEPGEALTQDDNLPENSVVLTIEERDAMYENMLRDAKAQGEEFAQKMREQIQKEREMMRAQATSEAVEIRKKAYQEGLEEGISQKKAQVKEKIEQLTMAVEELQLQHELFMESYTSEIQNFALDIASQILDVRISADEVVMDQMVQKALGSIKNAEWITVAVSDRCPKLIEALRNEITLPEVDIVGKDASPGTCLIETPGGMIDASISTQLDNLKDIFEHI